jgi:hypothetical protein
MSWVLEGMRVRGTYLDEFPVVGTVTLSRVCYGGTVNHHVRLDTPMQVYSAIRETVILEHKDVEQVYG